MVEDYDEDLKWFCVAARNKREHIAAADIRARTEFECYNPRISYKKKTRNGTRRFTEALFPGYLFVRCSSQVGFRHLLSMNGVKDVVHFGSHYPHIADEIISDIKRQLNGDCAQLDENVISEDSQVVVLDGPLAEMTATVCSVKSGQKRIAVLFELLGREVRVELPERSLMSLDVQPRELIKLAV